MRLRRPSTRSAARRRRLFHLAVPPAQCTSVIGLLGQSGLADDGHVIVEKPFGTDLESARTLNKTGISVPFAAQFSSRSP